jgi:hypothetical protein
MRPGRRSRFNPRKLLLWAAPLVGVGCGGGGTDVPVPSLSVTTTTSGVELDADGYTLMLDGNPGQPIGLDASLTIERLPEGPHSVGLTGLAANCAAANNPREVTVQAGATANAGFAVTCSAASGTIEATTTTSGPGSDPDGYALVLDGVDRGPIGVSASTSLAGLAPGTHLIGLTGLAATCQVVGENPRNVSITAGQTAQVPFAVTCAQPPLTSGNVRITTATSGNPLDPDGYSVSVDGGTEQAITANTSLTVTGLSVGAHTIRLAGVAGNCQVAGENPRDVTVAQGQTAAVSFTVTCSASTGGLAVTVSGLPAGAAAAITVAGPGSFSQTVTATQTLTGLAPGSYTVRAANVTAGGASYTGSVDRPTVTLTAGATAAVAVSYQVIGGASLNLRIDQLYLTQSTQTRTGTVPLIRNRGAFLRVFVVANEANSARPSVRVRFFRDGAVARELTIPASRSSTPTSLDEGQLGSSWNAEVDAGLVQPGTSVVADVDPGNSIAEGNESDNTFPTSGSPQGLTVRAASAARIRFVPIRQGSGPAGNVTAANKDQLVETARRMFPLSSIETAVRSAYTTSTVLNDDPNTWNQVLSEIDGLRVAEGSGETYYGVARVDNQIDLLGTAFLATPTAIGTDDSEYARKVLAHELGHTWNQLHAPCGGPNPSTIDPNYPYGAGIGVYGFDAGAGILKPPSASDIMGYCWSNPWISDYTYRRVLDYRAANPAGAHITSASKQLSLLVWGRIVNGQPVLEPAFQIVTRPSLPTEPGPYSVEAVAADGGSLFKVSFNAAEVADDPRRGRYFAFAVPIDPARAARLGSLRLTAPGGRIAAMSQRTTRLRATKAEPTLAQRETDGVALKWDASLHPMIMVRDPDTGEVLSFARGGNARVSTPKGEVLLEMSDGVKSQRLRLAISR